MSADRRQKTGSPSVVVDLGGLHDVVFRSSALHKTSSLLGLRRVQDTPSGKPRC
jgi:hypothetical protein